MRKCSSKKWEKDCQMRPCLLWEAGFSYVEVLIALVILALAFLVMLPGIQSLLANEVKQEASDYARILAGNVIEETKTLDSEALELLQDSSPQTVKIEAEAREYWIVRSIEATHPDDENLTCRLWHVDVSIYNVHPDTQGASPAYHLETLVFTY